MDAARLPLFLVILGVVGGGAAWMLRERPQPAPPKPAPVAAPEDVEQPPAPPLPAQAEMEHQATALAAEDQLTLPNGTKVPALNGVKGAPRMVWQNGPYSPILRTEHSHGYDWYVHADGSYSTTMMVWRSDLGRYDATTLPLHPRDPKPTRPFALPPGAVPEGAAPPGPQQAGKR